MEKSLVIALTFESLIFGIGLIIVGLVYAVEGMRIENGLNGMWNQFGLRGKQSLQDAVLELDDDDAHYFVDELLWILQTDRSAV